MEGDKGPRKHKQLLRERLDNIESLMKFTIAAA